jgi:hypothetical protein
MDTAVYSNCQMVDKSLFRMRPAFGGIVQSPSWRVSAGAERVRRYETPDTRRRVSSTTALWSLSVSNLSSRHAQKRNRAY